MSRTSRRIGEILISRGYIDPDQLSEALTRQQRGESNLIGFILVQMGFTGPEQVAESLAIQFGIPYVDPDRIKIDTQLVWKIPREMAEAKQLMPLDRLSTGLVRIAMANPRDLHAIRDVEFLLRATVTPVIASAHRVQDLIQRYYSMEHVATQMLAHVDNQRKPVSSNAGLELDSASVMAHLNAGGPKPYVDLLNFLMISAVERKASDIHLEPQLEDFRVRFRVDGMLREVLILPSFAIKPLTNRIKVVGKLDLSAYNKPQDGKVAANLEGRKLDMRIAVIPSQYGETVVIRLLDPAMLQTDLGELGWQPRLLSSFYRMASQPQGIVLCVGPTGSGKSTTLYATIHRLQSETTSIITVEDPIEYTIPGITQVQVNDRVGMTFSTVVRSLLRQDPNVIVIGEIRDTETADAAFEAANTGHLVLSTLHTNHAVSTITRLIDLRVPPYMLGSSLNGVVAQRLVRRVCPHCSIETEPEEEDWQRLGIEPIKFSRTLRRAGSGCQACRYVGYSGRVGVIEVLSISDDIRQLIIDNANEFDIWKKAREEGFTTLFDDALLKVGQGMTTLEEVRRVVPLEPWREDRGGPTRSPLVASELPPDRPIELISQPIDLEELSDAALEEIGDLPGLPMASVAPAVPAAPALILIADDAEEILNLVSITLEDDFEIVLARDGVEAMEKVALRAPDLLILDVMMPRMSGFDVCEQLKDNPATADIPVLFLSARGERPHVKRGFHVGADDYLAKPFDPEELLLRVRALLRRSQRRRLDPATVARPSA